MKILMVCLGNICRSPLAQGVLASKLDSNTHFVDSAGTAAYHVGEAPDRRSIKVAANHDIDISQQRARQFKSTDFEAFDRIYAMDHSNLENLKRMANSKEDLNKLFLFMESSPNNKLDEVPDPYYGDFSDFELVFNLVNETCNTIAHSISSQKT